MAAASGEESDMSEAAFIAGGILLLIVGGGIWAYIEERRAWNGGICRETGGPWQQFDTDSGGGRGYKSGGYRIWISWPVDRTKAEPPGE